MPKTKLYLDARRSAPGKPAPLKISIHAEHKTAVVSTGLSVLPEEWDADAERLRPWAPNADRLTNLARRRQLDAEDAIYALLSAKPRASLSELRQAAAERLDPSVALRAQRRLLLLPAMEKYAESKKGATRAQHLAAMAKVRAFCGRSEPRLSDVTPRWLRQFDEHMEGSGCSQNTRADYLICLRAVINRAITDGLLDLSAYPFRQFRIRKAKTAKRSLSAEQLRELFTYPCEEWQKPYLDFFKLSFLLRGLNPIDMLALKPGADASGRLEICRSKTSEPLSIKIEPEAAEIIERLRGEKRLLNPGDRYASVADYRRRLNDALRSIGPFAVRGRGGRKVREPLFPDLTAYWARHSWATIAAELDVPKETIAQGLGHAASSTTDIYIRYNTKKVDKANRRVIDFVLYGVGGEDLD